MRISGKNPKIKFSLSERKQSKNGPVPPTNGSSNPGKRVSFRILRRGSLTVEAAVSLPLFFMIVICVASIMGIYSAALETMVSLRDSAQTAAAAVGFLNEEVWIELPQSVTFTPLFLPSGVKINSVMCTGSARAWTGRSSGEAADAAQGNSLTYVYVAENASVYHTSSACTHINLSTSRVSSSSLSHMCNSSGSKYTSCEKCVGSSGALSAVYITESGNKYHNSSSCSGLKRTVKIVEKSEVGNLNQCSRCASMTQ